MTVVLYLVLQLLVAGYSLHRMPHYTALMLLVLLAIALLTGLVFRRLRSFCIAFCPVGALLSVYGRYTPLQLEARDPAVCERCPTRDCIKNKNRYHFDKRSCPSLLRPFHRNPSDGCVLCLQCVKVCPYDNMGLGLVSADAPVRRKTLLRPYEAAFVMVALGFVAHEVIGEVKWLNSMFHFVPEQLAALAPRVPFGWFEALWFLVLFPLTVWVAIAVVSYLAGHRSGLRSLLLAVATGAAPVVAIAHLAKAAAKVSAWGGFLPLSLRDPPGLATFHQLANRTLSAPTAAVGLPIIGWVMLALVVVIAWRALAWSRQVPAESTMAARVGLVGTGVLFSSILTVWALPSILGT
jgi:polyferredoxin